MSNRRSQMEDPSVRKTHNQGKKHKENVRSYYNRWMEDQAQALIDRTVKEAERQMKTNPYFLTGAPGSQTSAYVNPMIPAPLLPPPTGIPLPDGTMVRRPPPPSGMPPMIPPPGVPMPIPSHMMPPPGAMMPPGHILPPPGTSMLPPGAAIPPPSNLIPQPGAPVPPSSNMIHPPGAPMPPPGYTMPPSGYPPMGNKPFGATTISQRPNNSNMVPM